jgi:hypothetical protein
MNRVGGTLAGIDLRMVHDLIQGLEMFLFSRMVTLVGYW